MPKETNTVEVTPVEGSFGLQFWVTSRSDPDHPRLVDVSYYDGGARCSCPDWDMRVLKAIKADLPLFRKETTCFHVREVHRYLLMAALPAHIASHQQGRRNHDEG